MGKFRSKLKRHGKGKNWSKGQSAVSNPDQMKHRLKAKSRFFQPNLNLAASGSANGLTMEAVHKHEQRQAYNAETTTVNDVAGSLMSFTLDDDDGMSGTGIGNGTQPAGTFKTFQTFASNYTSCSNMSFKKLLTGFRASSDLHKEMLAILSALTEIIRERGGNESSTEYFLLLVSQIEAATEERDIIAGVALLSMGIKSVPAPVLRKRFDKTAATIQQLLQRFIDSSSQSVIRYLIGCLSVLLRAQDYVTWSYSSTFQYFDALLAFSIHSRPKIRRAAQHAVVSIIHGSCFMMPPQPVANDEDDDDDNDKDSDKNKEQQTQQHQQPKSHPASSRVTKFCLAQFKPEVLANQQTTVLHTLALLKDTLAGFRTEDIRNVCEHLLSIMTAANVLVRTNCFQALHALFLTRSSNLNATLCAKLLAAIHEYRPDRSDVRQTLAWITVLKEGHLHLATLQLDLCMQALPRLFDVCTTDLWMSERGELVVGVSNCIKELLQDCVARACATEQLADQHRQSVTRIIGSLHKVLNAPFGEISKYVILIFSIVFEACGRHFGAELNPSLATIGKRYESQGALRLQIEHTLISAIKALGPELVLRAIPLNESGGGVCLERSWLLPLMREGANGASLQFFKEYVVPLVLNSLANWRKYGTEEKDSNKAHIYELLCCQLWGLFPGFCRQPRDPEYLRNLAPTLGDALQNNPEFRAPIYDGLLELLDESQSDECHAAIGQYARNFLPRLFNIYIQKPTGSYEADQRKRALDVIRLYIARAPADVQAQLFESAQSMLAGSALASFEYDAYFDINAAIVRVQKCRGIEAYFEKYMAPVLRNDKSKLVARDEQKMKKQQRKTYELLRELMTSDQPSCQKFTRKNCLALQQILLEAFNTTCSVCQASRLHCLKSLLDCRSNLAYNDQLVMKAIPEAVLNYKEFSTRKEQVAEHLIKLIANLYQEAGKINEFVDILTAGFTGDESLITNTILAFRAVLQQQGQYLTVSTLEFVLQQVSVFLVQKSRHQAEAAVAFLITFIKVMPIPLVANHLETIMRSLSAMTKDTKRYCRIQIGYFLKKLCKRFTTEELARFVPGDDEVTHRRLKKIRKQMRRDTRKKQSEEAQAESSDEELVGDLEQKTYTIDDILADSDSDLPEDMEEMDEDGSATKKRAAKSKSKSKQARSTYIREDADEIVDLADLKSIGNVLTSGSATATATASGKPQSKAKPQLVNGGFKTADDGRLIISDKALRGQGKNNDDDDGSDSEDASVDSGHEPGNNGNAKRGMEDDSSDEEELHQATSAKRKRQSSDALSMRSGKTNASTRKGIHRPLGGAATPATATDAMSMKSGGGGGGHSKQAGSEYSSKKAKGDMKQRGKLDPYAYIPLTRNTLNKRKRAMNSRKFKSVVRGAGSGAGDTSTGGGTSRGRGRVGKSYK
ncbi:RRP12-like protein [Drosophila grimshawi]|uniref:GH12804 n=1 Tax=Drosophila grimshawi TaxID=7222 RepID=B4JL83_DROGR|nr:RRP12-like protein [Drosophila grimshawi]EDW00336.1 GH12804 [Drosophila grimshawi]